MSAETIIEVNPVRNKATFTHGEVAEMTFARDKAVRTHRVGVRKGTVAIRTVLRTGCGSKIGLGKHNGRL